MTDENLPVCAGPASQEFEQLRPVSRAITSCYHSGNDLADHFAGARKVILSRKRGQKAINASHLVRSDAARRFPICPCGHTMNIGTMPEYNTPGFSDQWIR
jgi:hypothetical protein